MHLLRARCWAWLLPWPNPFPRWQEAGLAIRVREAGKTQLGGRILFILGPWVGREQGGSVMGQIYKNRKQRDIQSSGTWARRQCAWGQLLWKLVKYFRKKQEPHDHWEQAEHREEMPRAGTHIMSNQLKSLQHCLDLHYQATGPSRHRVLRLLSITLRITRFCSGS